MVRSLDWGSWDVVMWANVPNNFSAATLSSAVTWTTINGRETKCYLKKQPTFGDATTGFLAKWRLRNERRNFILMTRHYPGLGSVSDWLNQISHRARPIRSTTQIWVVHQYGISPVVSQTSFGGEISDSVARRRLFSKAKQSDEHWNRALSLKWRKIWVT